MKLCRASSCAPHRIGGWCGVFLLIALALGQDELALESQRARQALESRRFDEAVRRYSELVKALPKNPGLLMNLGLALHSAGRYREAIGQFSAALKLDPSLTPAKVLIGVGYQKLAEPAKAVGPLEEAVRADPNDRLARLELADAFLVLSRFEEATPHFKILAELEPGNPKAWQGLGLGYLGLARRSFEALEKEAPDSPYVLALLARSLAERQQYRNAFYLYRQALGRGANRRGIHAALAEIYRQTGHPEWAKAEQERERQLPPPDCSQDPQECDFLEGRHEKVVAAGGAGITPVRLYWRARSYGQLALETLQKLSELPPSPALYELMAEASRVQNSFRRAAEELRQALRLDPGNRRLEAQLANVLWLDRKCEEARPLLLKLLAGEPGSAQLNFELGDCLLQQQDDPQKALPRLEKAVRANPSFLPARASLARAYRQLGRAGDEVEHLKAALPIDKDGSLHYQLARAYQRLGRPELAKAALEKFEALSQASAARKKLLDEERQITAP